MLEEARRLRLARVIAVMNNKGGVGKTSITANLAGVLAQSGYRVLAIDLDPQGTLGDDLGYRNTNYNDQGNALWNALAGQGMPLVPAKGIRPNLDIVAGGEQTSMLADALAGLRTRDETADFRLAEKLSAIADQYDVILFDCPPGEATLQSQALAAARWILIPTQPDVGSLQGLAQLAARVVKTRRINPTVAPLGVVLFPMVTGARRVQAQVRENLRTIMGEAAPVFTATIRFAQAAGVGARERGQLAIELARDAEGQDRFAFAKRLKAQQAGKPIDESPTAGPVADSAGSLAGDYLQLTQEVLLELAAQESLAKDAAEATS